MAKSDDEKLPKGITRDGDNYRVRVWWPEYRKQVSIGRFDSLKVAKAAKEAAQVEMFRNEFVMPSERTRRRKEAAEARKAERLTVEQWSEQWLDMLANDPERPRSPGTIASYRSTLNTHILGTLGSKPLSAVTEDHIAAVIATARTHGTGAGRNTARALRAMFNKAVEEHAGGLKESPVTAKLARGTASRVRGDEEVPDWEEVKAIAAAMPEDLRLTVLLAYVCQLRLGEVLGLQRADLDLDADGGPDLYVRRQWNSKANPPAYSTPKSGSARVVAIPPDFVPLIERHLAVFVWPDPEAPLFPSVRDRSRPISHNALARRWNEAREAGGRPGLAFHSLRHGGLTAYAREDATPTETVKRGGHSSPEVAARYQHSSRKRDHEIAERMGKRLNLGDLLG